MLALLPLFGFVLLLLLWHRLPVAGEAGARRRWAWLAAALSWGVLTALLTELLSSVGMLNRVALAAGWAIICAAAGVGMVLWPPRPSASPGADTKAARFPWVVLCAIALIASLIGVTALLAPPNNWDSLTYHMARVGNWQQHQSVAHYPTHELRQLQMPPWAEFAILHLQILSGSDRLANLVQWFSMIGSVIGVSLIAARLGATIRGQTLTALLCAALPSGILQASSTQNDYVVAFWLVCLAYFILRLGDAGAVWLDVVLAGAALGLAVLTKGTAYLYGLPLGLWLLLRLLRLRGRRAVAAVSCVALMVLTLNFGYYLRNMWLFGSPLGPAREYHNETLDPRAVLSNLTRGLSLQLATPIPAINSRIQRGVEGLHALIGLSPNDPRTTWMGEQYRVPPLSNHEDRVVNPLHMLLILAAGALLWCLRRERALVAYGGVLVLCLLVPAALLKWQPWFGRLHMPWFVLATPFVGIVAERVLRPRSVAWLAVFVVLAGLPWALFNFSRPLLGSVDAGATRRGEFRLAGNTLFNTPRDDFFFVNRPERREPYESAARYLRGLHEPRIGLILEVESWEYALRALVNEGADRPVAMEHVEVKNVSSAIGGHAVADPQAPRVIVLVGEMGDTSDQLTRAEYEAIWRDNSITIWRRGDSPRASRELSAGLASTR